MKPEDFHSHFERLKLDTVSPGVSVQATFVPDWRDATLASQPREALPVAPSDGTLPRLNLSAPDAVKDGAPDDTELTAVQVLGEGGMGRVLLARQHSLGREVAVKVLKTSFTGAAHGLIDEARTMGNLEHPSVVPVYALARDAHGLPALVMKRVEGVSWQQLIHAPNHEAWSKIANGRDPLEVHLEVLIQVCNAVAYAHRRGVIHRDLKPANVLVGELGEVYVADWGVAVQKGLPPGPPRLVGTPAYLAPEMVTGDAALMDERTDVYLLGATLHEVLTQKPPHQGSSLREVLERAWASQAPVFPSTVPGELASLCARALSANPSERPASVLELRDGVRQYLQHRGAAVLAGIAKARLDELEQLAGKPRSEAQQRHWYTLISECRFGFAQALRAHPSDAAALSGLRRCLEVAVREELAREQSAAARAFLSELAEPPLELLEAVKALEQNDAERAAGASKFREYLHENDPRVGAAARNRVTVVLGVAVAAILVALMIYRGNDLDGLPGWLRLTPIAVLLAVQGVSVLVWRKSLLQTRLNRQMVALVFVACFAVLLSRSMSVLLKLPVADSLVYDSVVLATLCAAAAIGFQWRFFVTGAIYGAGALWMARMPDKAPIHFGFFSLASLASLIWMVSRWKPDEPLKQK